MAIQHLLTENEISLDQDEIQGDTLVGLQKKAELFIFFSVSDVAQFRLKLPKLISDIAFLRETANYERAPVGDPAKTKVVKTNIALSFDGLVKLGMFTEADKPSLDHPFTSGARAQAPGLGDDVDHDWLPEFKVDIIHGIIIVAAYDKKPQKALVMAQAKATETKDLLGNSILEGHREEGVVREKAIPGGKQSGHEHFGFADGVSQPGVRGLTKPEADDGDQGFPGQDLVNPGAFLLGRYPRENGQAVAPPKPWMANGSYMVFRRLNQDTAAFRDFVFNKWQGHASGPAQFGARIVGRWPDGSPLVNNPDTSNPNESEENPDVNNDFTFGPKQDADQLKCPFNAHIRRVYPRDDLPDEQSEAKRIIRAGIAFGGDDDDDKGLLFVCYQSSIEDKFEFIQKSWANSGSFPLGVAADGIQVPAQVGPDLIIGQQAVRHSTWATGGMPGALPAETPKFVTATGGGYLFSPSKTGLLAIAAGA